MAANWKIVDPKVLETFNLLEDRKTILYEFNSIVISSCNHYAADALNEYYEKKEKKPKEEDLMAVDTAQQLESEEQEKQDLHTHETSLKKLEEDVNNEIENLMEEDTPQQPEPEEPEGDVEYLNKNEHSREYSDEEDSGDEEGEEGLTDQYLLHKEFFHSENTNSDDNHYKVCLKYKVDPLVKAFPGLPFLVMFQVPGVEIAPTIITKNLTGSVNLSFPYEFFSKKIMLKPFFTLTLMKWTRNSLAEDCMINCGMAIINFEIENEQYIENKIVDLTYGYENESMHDINTGKLEYCFLKISEDLKERLLELTDQGTKSLKDIIDVIPNAVDKSMNSTTRINNFIKTLVNTRVSFMKKTTYRQKSSMELPLSIFWQTPWSHDYSITDIAFIKNLETIAEFVYREQYEEGNVSSYGLDKNQCIVHNFFNLFAMRYSFVEDCIEDGCGNTYGSDEPSNPSRTRGGDCEDRTKALCLLFSFIANTTKIPEPNYLWNIKKILEDYSPSAVYTTTDKSTDSPHVLFCLLGANRLSIHSPKFFKNIFFNCISVETTCVVDAFIVPKNGRSKASGKLGNYFALVKDSSIYGEQMVYGEIYQLHIIHEDVRVAGNYFILDKKKNSLGFGSKCLSGEALDKTTAISIVRTCGTNILEMFKGHHRNKDLERESMFFNILKAMFTDPEINVPYENTCVYAAFGQEKLLKFREISEGISKDLQLNIKNAPYKEADTIDKKVYFILRDTSNNNIKKQMQSLLYKYRLVNYKKVFVSESCCIYILSLGSLGIKKYYVGSSEVI